MTMFLRGFVLGLVVILSACAPRGETKSLDQVYKDSKARFAKVSAVAVPEDVAPTIQNLNTQLEQLAAQSADNATQTSAQVAEALASIIEKAGYTARPAMGEIISQHRMLSRAEAPQVTNAQAKLLAARTYALLASELETTKFAVQ